MSLKLLVFVGLSTLFCVYGSINDLISNGGYQFIDLTHPFDNNTVYWERTQKFVFTKKQEGYRHDGTWYAAYDFAAAEHGGTHIDAPYHFAKMGLRVGELPLEKLIVPLIVVDISSRVGDNNNFVLYKYHLDYLLNYNMGMPCVLLFKFGWAGYFNDTKKYLGLDEATDTLSFPGLSNEIAEWITKSYKNVVGVGVDVASVDPGSSLDFPVHKTFAHNGIYMLENVNLNQTVPEYGCTAVVMPMKIAEGTGAPVRFVAMCPKIYSTPSDIV